MDDTEHLRTAQTGEAHMRAGRPLTESDWQPLAKLAMKFAHQREQCELELLESIYADPVRGICIAEGEGVTQFDFSQPDLKLIWLAADIARAHGKKVILRVARRALRAEGYYDPTQTASNFGNMRWSDVTLSHLATTWFFSSSLIRQRARRLVAVVARQRRAERLYREMIGTLQGFSDVAAETLPKRQLWPSFVLVDRKRGAA